MIRTGLFGGSFNPIHNGHILLARQLLERVGLDEVWFMVSPQNPFKQACDLLDDGERLRLVKLALAEEPKMKACDYEFRLPRPSYTWNTLQHLATDCPDREFTLLIGGDNWAKFGQWYRASDIINRYHIAVYPRPGYAIDGKTALPSTVTLVDTPLMDISSSDIRKRIREGASISGLVPEAVEQSIASSGFYQI